MRFVRMIENSTFDQQSARWDMNHLANETAMLFDAISNKRTNITAELLAEEIFCRVDEISNHYEYLPREESIRHQPREGYDISLRWVEREKRINLKIQWLQTGQLRYETLKKYIKESTDSVMAELRAGGWYDVNRTFSVGGTSFDAFVNLSIRFEETQISTAAKSIASAIEILRKLASRAT